jgi:hypothetical protein
MLLTLGERGRCRDQLAGEAARGDGSVGVLAFAVDGGCPLAVRD